MESGVRSKSIFSVLDVRGDSVLIGEVHTQRIPPRVPSRNTPPSPSTPSEAPGMHPVVGVSVGSSPLRFPAPPPPPMLCLVPWKTCAGG